MRLQAMASSQYDLNCWWDLKTQTNSMQIPKRNKSFQTIAAVLILKLFKLIKKALEKLSRGLHNTCYIRSLKLSIVLHVMGWG